MKDVKDFGRVECAVCGHRAHFLEPHIVKEHGMTVEEYQEKHSGAPLLSLAAKDKLEAMAAQAGNKLVKKSIKPLFGIEVFKGQDETLAFDKPHDTTPEVDPDFVFLPDILGVVLMTFNDPKEKCLLFGPTGSGKTSNVEQAAARLNWPYYRLNFDGDITRSDIVGQWVLMGKEMVFCPGILVKAIREEACLCIDEWDCASPSTGMLLQAVLEGRPLTLLETGEILKVRKDGTFRIFATANTVGQGDDTGLYNGTTPQNFATVDRFSLCEHVDYPTVAQEKQILIRKAGIKDKEVLDKLTRTAKLIRDAFLKEEIRVTMSTRSVVNVADKLNKTGDVARAYTIGFLNKINGADKEVCRGLIQRTWGV